METYYYKTSDGYYDTSNSRYSIKYYDTWEIDVFHGESISKSEAKKEVALDNYLDQFDGNIDIQL